jgi:hypothetical protein
MVFILLFFLLNSFFFIPRYILERKSSTFLPYKGFLTGPVKERIQFAINRFNYDIFRMSIDFLFLTLLVILFKDYFSVRTMHILVFALYAISLIYQLYYHGFENVYKVEPLFYRDYLLLKTGVQIFFREFTMFNILITFAVIAAFTGIYFLLGSMVMAAHDFKPGTLFWIVAGGLVFLSLYSLITYNYKAFGKIVFPSQLQSLIRNIRASLQTQRQMGNVDFKKIKNHRPYQNVKLNQHPNIYFIPIESYGRILYDHPDLKEEYKTYMTDLEASLSQADWQSATNLSLAPITGGASWVSYSSALFGMDVKDQGIYLTLLNTPEMHEYQHLMRWLKHMGYTNYRLAPIAGFKGMRIPWETYSSFYAIDEWIKYEDMNYTGPLIGFGPCPPDQFSLGFARDFITKKGTAPFCLFFITQNSHSPFNDPGRIAEHWSDWSDGSQVDQGSSSIFVKPKLSDYAKAIRYQMTFLIDFILKQGTENDIFILMGDHQPPTFPEVDGGLETPIHIIGKNQAFIHTFLDNGFENGLYKNTKIANMRHQGLFSLIVRSLIDGYGGNGQDPVKYEPHGLDWLNM